LRWSVAAQDRVPLNRIVVKTQYGG